MNECSEYSMPKKNSDENIIIDFPRRPQNQSEVWIFFPLSK